MGLKSFLTVSAAGNGIYTAVPAATGAALLPRDWLAPGLAVPILIPVLVWQRHARKSSE